MKTIKEQTVVNFSAFMTQENLSKGEIAVPVDQILTKFQASYPEVPVTKALFGRICTKHFYKKQIKVGELFTQCYFLNKEINP